ncbi:MAG: hypothetical protein A2041_09765 [Bacteroidetes bacterium GWA2_31_9b]|nr:MAG: hypothetical protein A2041_09765 [Bacteroidetes bacterium GWA2_31_9b]
MKTYISILRGINVSGQKLIKMDALRQMYSDLGFKNIHSYIQSGNIIFQAQKIKHEYLEKKITEKIVADFGFNVPVIVMEFDYLSMVLKNNPFVVERTEDITKLYVTFLSHEPVQANIDKINIGQFLPDEFILKGKTIYLFCPNGYGKTKLTNSFFENKFKVVATTRNWNTINELYKISEKVSIY